MRSDTVLDYAVFELSPKHSRCELFVTSNEETEKLASGLIEPFVNHLRVLESLASPIRLEVEETNTWFTKRTLERFVQFVNSPESLEKVNTYYSEMSQLEAARTLYSQRSEDSKSGASDDGAAADATKKELLRAIDLRLEAIKKDLTSSIDHASASGFDPHTVSELQQFADRFGAQHLGEACSKYVSLRKKRPDLIDVKSSNRLAGEKDGTRQKEIAVKEPEHQIQQSASTSSKRNEEEKSDESVDVTSSTVRTIRHTRRLSVQDRINLFESKQKENSNSGGSKPVAVTKSAELKRLSSDLAFSEKPVLRRISVVSDRNLDLALEKKLESSTEGSSSTPSSVPSAVALKESCESIKKGEEIKYELKSNYVKACDDDEVTQERVESSKTTTDKSLVSGVEATSDAQSRSVTDSNDSSASQNQTDSYVDKLRNAMSDAKSRQREEANDINTKNVSQSSVIFPSRHTRSRSVHMEAGIQEDLTSQPQFRSSVSRIKKKEVVASDEQPQKQQFNIRDCIDDGEGKQVRANNNRFPMGSVDQVQRTRLSKENTGANDELKLKANELEKLFAEHKLRVPGDQSSSSRRGKASETQVAKPESSPSIGTAEKSLYPGSGSGDLSKLITPLVGDKDKGDALRRNFSDLSCLTDDSKGKFYDKYMKKRDAKLREEWSLKKGEKETKLKSMHEALEQSRTEMKAKLSASSSERRDSLSSTRQRAEKFRSFNSRSSMKKYQHPINSFQSEEDEDCSDQKPRGKDKQASGQQSIASRSSQARKVQPNRNMPSSITPRSAASVPKPSGKVSNTSSGRRRSDKSLAQSVPNFSDLIKENTKSSSLAVKTTMRSQVRSSGRIKNTKEDIPLQRPRSLRKSSSGNIDFTELSALCSDDMMASLNSDISENMKNEEYDEPEPEAEAEAEEVLEDYVRGGEEEEAAAEELETSVFKDENPTLSDVYEKVDNLEEENCSFLPTNLPSRLLTASSLMDSPGESPLSWNANLQHAFSYPHEHSSDIDASADSPMGSPASWSSRMRKKWGTAQSPVTVAAASNLSQLQSKKDLTKGFKRLLKFGRKSRGAESLMMDWASVTTSEGDDEVEDRRDLADRSSDDLRKSRMGSLQSHLSEDGCNESEFTEQASSFSIPELKEDYSNIKAQKSFFSLSTFRGKGNDSKPR